MSDMRRYLAHALVLGTYRRSRHARLQSERQHQIQRETPRECLALVERSDPWPDLVPILDSHGVGLTWTRSVDEALKLAASKRWHVLWCNAGVAGDRMKDLLREVRAPGEFPTVRLLDGGFLLGYAARIPDGQAERIRELEAAKPYRIYCGAVDFERLHWAAASILHAVQHSAALEFAAAQGDSVLPNLGLD